MIHCNSPLTLEDRLRLVSSVTVCNKWYSGVWFLSSLSSIVMNLLDMIFNLTIVYAYAY